MWLNRQHLLLVVARAFVPVVVIRFSAVEQTLQLGYHPGFSPAAALLVEVATTAAGPFEISVEPTAPMRNALFAWFVRKFSRHIRGDQLFVGPPSGNPKGADYSKSRQPSPAARLAELRVIGSREPRTVGVLVVPHEHVGLLLRLLGLGNGDHLGVPHVGRRARERGDLGVPMMRMLGSVRMSGVGVRMGMRMSTRRVTRVVAELVVGHPSDLAYG